VGIYYDGDQDIRRFYLMQHSVQASCFSGSDYAHSNTGRVPFMTRGVEASHGDASRRVVEAYRLLLPHNERHPHKAGWT
jgi:hypothetical protein